MERTGRGLTHNVTLPLLAAGTAAVKMSQDFQVSMSRVQGLAGQSQKQMNAWSKQLLDLAPQIGKSPNELAKALYFVSSSGVEASKVMDVVTVSAKAAAAGLGDTQVVADAVTSAMNAYSKAGLTAQDATDVLVAAVREGKGEAAQFAPILGQVIPIAAELGVGFDQVGAALAAMTRLGTPAADAATYLSATFSQLTKVTPQQEKAFRAVGLTSEELRKQLGDRGLLFVLRELEDRFHGNVAAMAQAFPNIRALRGVLELVGQSAGDTAGIFKRMEDNTGSLGKAWEAYTHTDAYKMNQSINETKVALIELGQALAPFAREAAQDVRRVAQAFESLSPHQQAVLVKFLGIIAVAGPFLLATGKIVKGIEAIRAASALATVGASGKGGVGGLVTMLNKMPKSVKTAIVVTVSYQFVAPWMKKAFEQYLGADFSGPQAAGDLKPVFRNGKWVDPNTGTAVADQRYWNNQWRAQHGGQPPSGSTAGGYFPNAGGQGSSAVFQTGGYPLSSSGGLVGTPGQGTHSRSERGYIWQDDDAVDIEMQAGTKVIAVEDGVLTGARYGGDSGRFSGWGVTLTGDSGAMYFYKHIKTLWIGKGRVKKGQAIGVGTTTGHLHFARRGAQTTAQVLGQAAPPTSGGGKPNYGGGAPAAGGPNPLAGLDTSPTDITAVPPNERIALANAGQNPSRQLSAYRAILRTYVGRQGRSLSPDDRAALAEAIADVKAKIVAAQKDIAAAASAELSKQQEQFSRALGARVMRGVTQYLSNRAFQQAVAGGRSVGSDIIKHLLGVDPGTVVEIKDQWGQVVDKVTAGQLIARVNAAMRRLEAAYRTGSRRAVTAARNELDKLREIAQQSVDNAAQAAADAAAQRQSTFETAFGRVASRILTAFDRQTQGQLSAMQAALSSNVATLQAQFDQQVTGMQARLQARIAQLQEQLQAKVAQLQRDNARLTPSEQALSDLQSQHDAEATARAMADAQRELALARDSNDPERIRAALDRINELQYEATVAALQKKAEAERKDQDERTQAQVDALTKQEQAQEQSLTQQEQAQEESLRTQLDAKVAELQAEEAAAEQAYTDERDAQRQTLEDTLADWQTNIENHKVTWADFMKWVGDTTGDWSTLGSDTGGAFARAFIAELQVAANAQAALTGGTAPNLVGQYRPTVTRTGSVGGSGGLAEFADGAYVRGGRGGVAAWIGEGSHDEVVFPLDRARMASLGVGNTEIHIHIAGSVIRERELAETIRRTLLRGGRHNLSVGLS